jgi:hypothetical protein
MRLVGWKLGGGDGRPDSEECEVDEERVLRSDEERRKGTDR